MSREGALISALLRLFVYKLNGGLRWFGQLFTIGIQLRPRQPRNNNRRIHRNTAQITVL